MCNGHRIMNLGEMGTYFIYMYKPLPFIHLLSSLLPLSLFITFTFSFSLFSSPFFHPWLLLFSKTKCFTWINTVCKRIVLPLLKLPNSILISSLCSLQVNVYTLGKTYLKLSQELHINVPAIGEIYTQQRSYLC